MSDFDSISFQPIPAKKKSKKVLLTIILSIVVLLVLGGAVTYAFYGSVIKQKIMGDAKYFAYVETKNLKSGVTDFVDLIQPLNQKSLQQESKDASMDFTYVPGTFVSQSLNGKADFLKELNFNITSTTSGKNSMAVLTISRQGEKVAHAEFISTPDRMLVKVNELSDNFISVPLQSTSSNDIKAAATLSFDKAQMEKELNRLADSLIAQLDNVKITNNVSVQIDGETVKLNEIKVTISKEKQKAIAKSLINDIKSSDVIYGAISEGMTRDAYNKFFDDLLTSAESYDTNGEPLIYTIYTDRNENVVGRSLSDSKGSISYKFNNSKDSRYFEGSLKVAQDESKLVISEKSDKKYAEFTSGNTDVKLDYSSMIIDRRSSTAKGKFELTTSDNIFYASGSIDISKEEAIFDISAKVSNNDIGQFMFDVKNIQKGSVTIPEIDDSKVVDSNQYVADPNVTAKIPDLVKKLGIPEEFFMGTGI